MVTTPEKFVAYNYGICFLDLLGQRAIFRGEAWLPPASTDDEQKRFFEEKIRPTVKAVIDLQQRAENMISSVTESRPDSSFRMSLPPEHGQFGTTCIGPK
jgi:hypothetical protein